VNGLKPTAGSAVNSKSTWMGAFVNPHVQFTNPASDPRGQHSDPSGNVPLYLRTNKQHMMKGLRQKSKYHKT
jgi:hypothetical protein